MPVCERCGAEHPPDVPCPRVGGAEAVAASSTATGGSAGGAPAPPAPDPSGGNLLGGLALGFFGGCVGLLIAYVLHMRERTKLGVAIGFGLSFVGALAAKVILTLR